MSAGEGVQRTYGVYELNHAIQQALYRAFRHEIWVQGEISGLRGNRADRNLFFDLVEPDPRSPGRLARAGIAILTSHRPRIEAELDTGEIRLEDGMHVRLRGRVDVYRPRGRLQLTVTGIDVSYTLGHLARHRDMVLRRLADAGLLDANARRPFPTCPLRVGLVTSAGSAAAADFIHELQTSGLGFDLSVFDTAVQGQRADARLAVGVQAVGDRADVIAIVRGGGSRTEMAVFDSEVLARAIAMSPVPVLTGIGHEIDLSIADRVSHLSLKTPTACARHLVESVRSFATRVDRGFAQVLALARQDLTGAATRLNLAGGSVVRETARRMHLETQRLTGHHKTLVAGVRRDILHTDERLRGFIPRLARVGDRTLQGERELRLLRARIQRAAERCLLHETARIDQADTIVSMSDPGRLTARGWALVRGPDGKVVVRTSQVRRGDIISIRIKDGDLTAVVDELIRDTEEG